MKLRALLLAGLCVAGGQARAGLFNDDEARQQIQQVGARVSVLEDAGKKQAETNSQQAETNKQQSRALVDLQAQIESLGADLRNLRGQIEELVHNLQDADKRQKDFYVDLDTRLRRFEMTDVASAPAASGVPAVVDDPVAGDRAYEAAHGLFRAGKHQVAIDAFQEFLKKFPQSVYAPSAYYEMGAAYFVLNDYQKAQASYQLLLSKYGFSPKAPEAMLGVADCQRELKNTAAAKKTLKLLISKYPGSDAAGEAKKRLAAFK